MPMNTNVCLKGRTEKSSHLSTLLSKFPQATPAGAATPIFARYVCAEATSPPSPYPPISESMNWNDILQHWPFMVFVLLCASVVIHLFYQGYFFLRLVLFKSQDKFQSQTHPVSVVICARDEAHNLEKNLPPSLLSNTLPRMR